MSSQTPQKNTAQTNNGVPITDEHILVVHRDKLFPDGLPEGFMQGVVRKNIEEYEGRIRKHGEFLHRPAMEVDERYKQIIPYFVFTHSNRLFLVQRSAKASEQRLASKYSLGIGGHVREDDVDSNDIAKWGAREFHEEVVFDGNITVMPLGIINDESSPVGRVHLGVVYLVHGDSDAIEVKEELAGGALCTAEECEALYDKMEPWSQLVFDTLKKAKYI